jgi:tetratricopeptide (TPR) repeat protein
MIAEAKKEQKNRYLAWEKAVPLDPSDPRSQNLLALVLVDTPEEEFHDPVRAVKLAQKSVAADPSKGNAWNTLGVAYFRIGKWESSIHAVKNSLQSSDRWPSHFFLAMAHFRMGDKAAAQGWYDQAGRWLDGNDPDRMALSPESVEDLTRLRREAELLLGISSKGAVLHGMNP